MAYWASANLSASDIDKAADAVPAILAETKCPSCNSSDASEHHSVEGIKTVRFCSNCDTVFGVDDSMNVNDLNQEVMKTLIVADLASENLSASDIDKAADEVPAILAEIKCPSCNSSDESGYHSVDGVKNVKFCSSCNTVFGIDDTMNVNDLNQDVKKNLIVADWTSETLSTSDIERAVDAVPAILAETKCPNCNSSDESVYHSVEGMKNVKCCSSCDTLFGIDDSMNVNDLRQLMEEGKLRFKTENSCSCGNDDVDKFLFEKCQQSGKLLTKCMNCNLTKVIETISGDFDATSEGTKDRVLSDGIPFGGNVLSTNPFADQMPHQRYKPFTFECEKKEDEPFEKAFDESESCLVSARCDRETKLRTNQENCCLIECGKCGCNTEDLFEKKFDIRGKIVDIFCRKCKTHLQCLEFMKLDQYMSYSELQAPPTFISYEKTKVTSLETLKRGDHVAWKRCGGIYYHHAIVAEVLSENKLEIIHYKLAKKEGNSFKILRSPKNVVLSKGNLYLCNYKPGDYLEPDEVIARAESQVGKKKYNLFWRNCEHFATLCKTSRSFSIQVRSVIDGVIGQLLIPVPGFGGIVGSTVGNMLRRAIGEKRAMSLEKQQRGISPMRK